MTVGLGSRTVQGLFEFYGIGAPVKLRRVNCQQRFASGKQLSMPCF